MSEEKKNSSRATAHRWCLTLFQEEGSNIPDWEDFFEDNQPKFKYFVGQQEVCPRTHRVHWQMFLVLDNPTTFNNVKTRIFKDYPGIHIEMAKGTSKEASDYCKKDESFMEGGIRFEYGAIGKQGERNDIKKAILDIERGKRMRDVAMNNSTVFVKYHKGLDAYRNIIRASPMRNRPTIYYWFGPTGVGKSRFFHEVMQGLSEYYNYDCSMGNWFQGYDAEPTIFMDEYKYQEKPNQLGLSLTSLLKLWDRGPFSMQTKGGSVSIHAANFFIAGNATLSDLYCVDHQKFALERRILEFGIDLSDPYNRKVLVANCKVATLEEEYDYHLVPGSKVRSHKDHLPLRFLPEDSVDDERSIDPIVIPSSLAEDHPVVELSIPSTPVRMDRVRSSIQTASQEELQQDYVENRIGERVGRINWEEFFQN